MPIYTEKELADALKNESDYIEIEGALQKKVLKIKATGTVAWGICLGAIAVAVIAATGTAITGGAAAPVASGAVAFSAAAALPVLGLPSTISAVSIAIAAGGVSILNKLRKYNTEKKGNLLILKRKA